MVYSIVRVYSKYCYIHIVLSRFSVADVRNLTETEAKHQLPVFSSQVEYVPMTAPNSVIHLSD